MCFCFSDFGIFWRENHVTKFPPNFVFIIMGYLMMISERSHRRDVKSEKKKSKYVHPLKRYSFLKFEFEAILCYS